MSGGWPSQAGNRPEGGTGVVRAGSQAKRGRTTRPGGLRPKP